MTWAPYATRLAVTQVTTSLKTIFNAGNEHTTLSGAADHSSTTPLGTYPAPKLPCHWPRMSRSFAETQGSAIPTYVPLSLQPMASAFPSPFTSAAIRGIASWLVQPSF